MSLHSNSFFHQPVIENIWDEATTGLQFDVLTCGGTFKKACFEWVMAGCDDKKIKALLRRETTVSYVIFRTKRRCTRRNVELNSKQESVQHTRLVFF